MPTIFHKILSGEIPCTKILEDEHCIAIQDIHPVAPVHILIIPRQSISSLATVKPEDAPLLGHLLWTAHKLALELGLDTGFRVVINAGIDGLQSVNQLHVHLMGGRGFSWPPG